MSSKAQKQKNANDTTDAYERFRDLHDKHLPRTRVSILNYTATISTKRGY